MLADKNKIISIEENTEASLIIAVEFFHSGRIFIYPTDTIYGIGGNPFDERVISRIGEIKGRDETKKFIWLLSDFENVMNYTEINFESHIEFLNKIWPAPVTVVLNLNKRTKDLIDQQTIAVRIPGNDFCLKLLREISRPLISTSVNRSGEKPLNNVKNIINDYSNSVDAIFYNSMDFSTNSENISSTIIDLTSENPKLIREGSIKFVELLQKFS